MISEFFLVLGFRLFIQEQKILGFGDFELFVYIVGRNE